MPRPDTCPRIPNVSAVASPLTGFLPAHSPLSGRIAAFNWSATPLGPIGHWPQSLRTALVLMLDSRFAMCLCWGPQLTLFYNDAYAPLLGAREPRALGRPLHEIWSDVWADIRPLVDSVMSGTPTWNEDMPLTVLRNGYPEETHWTFSYSPLRDEHSGIAGFLNITTEVSRKVQSERRLRADVEQLGRMFGQAPSFMAMLSGPDHVVRYVNPAYQRLIGERDVVGRPVAEAMPELAAQGFHALLDEVYRSGTPFAADSARLLVQPAPGIAAVERYVDFVYQPISDEQGVTGIFVQGVDVTERRRSDTALRAREAELQTINNDLEREVYERERARDRSMSWQLTADLLAVVAPDGRIEAANPAWERLLGWPPAELPGECWADLVVEEDQAAARQVLATLRQGHPVLNFESRWRTRAGSLRTLSWMATPQGERFYCSARDITEVRAAHEALARSQAQLRVLFETSYQLQAMCTLDGTLTDVNRTVLEALHVEFDELVGMTLWSAPLFAGTPGMEVHVRGMFLRALEGETVRDEVTVELASGHRIYDLAIRPIRDAGERIIAIAPEAIDITDRRNAEAALRQSQKLEAMGQLTGGVAHDFNNLLTPIMTALELAADPGSRVERRTRMVQVARRSAERAATLVQRLLAFSRRQPLQPVEIDAGVLVAGMAELIESSSSPRVQMVVDIADALLPAVADANQLEMAILNLSVNACDAMPDGGVLTLAVRNDHAGDADRGLSPGDYVVVSVADTGHGMDEATRQRAVEPFFSTKGVGRGTGLGLSMAHGLASQLGGRLAIDSTPGVGTRIELWLPVGRRPAAANPDTNEELDVDTATKSRGIALVVDDDDGVRMCTADALDDMGYQVIEAASAEAALEALDDGLTPDVLVTDHLMPGMTGAELAREVRVRLPSTAVVIVSGYTSMADFDPGLTILGKPFRQHELVASVEAAAAAKAAA